MEELKVGTCYEKKFIVNKEDTALALGSGGEEVLATPQLVAWMENTAFAGVEGNQSVENTTVGTFIELKHMAASPVGMEIQIKATLVSIEKRTLNFDIDAWDAVEKIGEAIHQRVIVDKARFNEKVLKKLETSL
ncbi:MAG: thioesterase family protein [Acetobacterium sp.]|nr:thioesterase family protein [uncultured Acetobacterium sp.]MCG2730507.1 thioesterase family protein [Acetobacterium sp.]